MKINPVAKLGCNLMGVVLSFMVFDLKRLSILLGAALVTGALEGNLDRRGVKKAAPLLLFGVGMFTTTLLWGSGDFSGSFSYSNFETGLKLFLRIAIIGALAMGFLFNINPNEMLLSLMQNLKLNPGIAYGVMAAFRFFPMMEEDVRMIRAAHSIRNRGRRRGVSEYISMPIPLLAANVRRAEKVAVAMEARGFDRFSERTSYRRIPWRMGDTLYLLAAGCIFTGIYLMGGGVGDWNGF